MLKFAVVIAIVFLCAWAAPPAGYVSSPQPFEINGAVVPMDGMAAWPFFPGDLIVARSAPVTITFRDGSHIVLEPNSKLRIDVKNKKGFARLLAGSGKYYFGGAFAALSTVSALALAGTWNTGTPASRTTTNPQSVSPIR